MTDRESRDTIPDLSMAQAVDAEKAYMVREAEDAYQVLSVQGMLKLSEQNAIALRCSQSAALRHLVFDAELELTRARSRLLRNAAKAATLGVPVIRENSALVARVAGALLRGCVCLGSALQQNAIALRCFDAELGLTRARSRLLRNAAEAAHEIAKAELSDS